MVTPLLTPLAQRHPKPLGDAPFLTKAKMSGFDPETNVLVEADSNDNTVLQHTHDSSTKKRGKLRLKKQSNLQYVSTDESKISGVNTKTLLQQFAT